METIRKAGMKLKPSKWEFHKTEREYLGFIINPEGVRADPVKTRAIEQWEPRKQEKTFNALPDSATSIGDLSRGLAELRDPWTTLPPRTEKKTGYRVKKNRTPLIR